MNIQHKQYLKVGKKLERNKVSGYECSLLKKTKYSSIRFDTTTNTGRQSGIKARVRIEKVGKEITAVATLKIQLEPGDMNQVIEDIPDNLLKKIGINSKKIGFPKIVGEYSFVLEIPEDVYGNKIDGKYINRVLRGNEDIYELMRCFGEEKPIQYKSRKSYLLTPLRKHSEKRAVKKGSFQIDLDTKTDGRYKIDIAPEAYS